MMGLFSRIAKGCYLSNIVLTIENMCIQLLELKDLGASGNAAQGVYRDTSKAVVNTGGYSRLRFFLRNKLATTAIRKATCKDAVLIRRKRAVYR